jgi:hypothetical protein
MMRAIYQQGSRTLVWLGPDSLSIIRAFLIIPKLLKASKISKGRSGVDTAQDSAEIPSHFTPRLLELLSIFELPFLHGSRLSRRLPFHHQLKSSAAITLLLGTALKMLLLRVLPVVQMRSKKSAAWHSFGMSLTLGLDSKLKPIQICSSS